MGLLKFTHDLQILRVYHYYWRTDGTNQVQSDQLYDESKHSGFAALSYKNCDNAAPNRGVSGAYKAFQMISWSFCAPTVFSAFSWGMQSNPTWYLERLFRWKTQARKTNTKAKPVIRPATMITAIPSVDRSRKWWPEMGHWKRYISFLFIY